MVANPMAKRNASPIDTYKLRIWFPKELRIQSPKETAYPVDIEELRPITIEEKVQKKNDVMARSMLLMALPNEHLMTYNQYKDAKTLFAAIQTRFGGNEATKKTRKTLLKQMLQKILSQLAILGENISQEDLNLKFLRSMPSEWNTHVVVWRNKPNLDTMSFDDLYNNFKIIEQEVKRTASSSSSSHNMAFVSSPSSTNEVNTVYEVSTANLSDATVYAFLSNQPNGYQLVHEDLEQIHKDNLEEMDLKWRLALLSMRTRRGPRNQDSRNMNQDSSRRTVNVEETSSKSMVAIDGVGFDWSYMADDEVPTNMVLMAFSVSEFNKSEFNLATYKRGLASIEKQLVFYKKNEKSLSKEKESNQLKIENFDNASKSLDTLIRSQITDKSRKGVGFVSYNVVPPPYTGLFSPLNLDLSYSGLEEFQQPEFEGYGPKTSKSVSEDISNEVKEYPDAPFVKELVSDDKLKKNAIITTYDNLYSIITFQTYEFHSAFVLNFLACLSQADCNYHQRERVVSENNYTRVNYNYSAKKAHPSAHRNMVPRAVLMKTGLRPFNTARPINTAHPKTTVYSARPMSRFSKLAQSTGHPQKEYQGCVDSGCSRHITGNMSYLSDFKEFDGGYVTFGGGAKGGKITGK
ncbi:hypothetical protein Tco_0983515 [Tanacetum coccineum]